MKDKTDVKNFNFIGVDSSLKGELNFKGPTYFYGNLEGSIYQEDFATLNCEMSSFIHGNIYGANIEIYGEVIGNIHATNHLTIYPTAKISGNIKSKNFKIYAGANFNGEMNSTQSNL